MINMGSKARRKYHRDFKRNAVLLCTEPGRSVSEVAEKLEIEKSLLYRWRREYLQAVKPYLSQKNSGETLAAKQKIRELEKKLQDTEMERDVLKKAMAILSRTAQ